MQAFCEFTINAIISETYVVATEHLWELITQLIQCALRSDSDSDEAARSVSCLCKAANRLELHLLMRFSRSQDTLRGLVCALEEHSATLFGAHNTDLQMLMLIAHALFEHCFFHTDTVISASGMRVFARILSARRAALLPLLAYQDSTGTPRSLFPDGFDKLLDKDGNMADDLRAFTEWITGVSEGYAAREASAGRDAGRMPMPQAARDVIVENTAKYKAQHAYRTQRKFTQEQAVHHKQRLARLRRKFARNSEEGAKMASLYSLARNVQFQTHANWSKVQRRRLQNLESVSAYTMELWGRERAELYGERGVFGADIAVFRKGDSYMDIDMADDTQLVDDPLSKASNAASSNCKTTEDDKSANGSSSSNRNDNNVSSGAGQPTDGDGKTEGSNITRTVVHKESNQSADDKIVKTQTQNQNNPNMDASYGNSAAHVQDAHRHEGRDSANSMPTHGHVTRQAHHHHDTLHTPRTRKRRVWWRLDFTEGPQRMRRRLEVDLCEMVRPRYEASPNVPGLFLPIRSAFVLPKTGSGSWETREDLLEPQAMAARCVYEVCMCVYRYMYTCMCVYVCVYIYIHTY
jgi:hypothetical protein